MTLVANRASSPWWAEPADDAAAALDVDPAVGLTPDEVTRRREEFGSNDLEEEPTTPPWRIFVSQFFDTMIVVLLVAMLVTVLIDEVTDAIVIGAIVVLNAIIGFVQEYRAEQAMAALRRMSAPSARVVRSLCAISCRAAGSMRAGYVRFHMARSARWPCATTYRAGRRTAARKRS